MGRKDGMVYLVGAGPGDPELLTLKGKRLLSRAEVLVYDRLASGEFLKLVPDGCENIYVGKEPGRHSKKQEEINRILIEKALAGKLVVRLKGGDPFVFGRGGEEILELEKYGIAYEVVPGVTSAIAALAHAGIPVTHRGIGQSFHVITGHTAVGKGSVGDAADTLTDGFCEYAKLSGTLIFLMGLSNLEQIIGRLLANGKAPETPAAVVTDGTLPQMRCVRAPLGSLVEAVRTAGLKAPGIIVVGETAAFQMSCHDRGPLSGVSIGVTGTDGIYEKLSGKLTGLGARVVRAASLSVKKENGEALSRALEELKIYRWIVFTSRNAVSIFFDAVRDKQLDLREFGQIKFAVVGQGTRDFLKSYGFFADYMPEEYTTAALAEGLSGLIKAGERILIPRAREGSKALTEILSGAGLSFMDLPIYDVETQHVDGEALSGLDYITFESGSGVRGFFAEEPEKRRKLFDTVRPVCIGAVTAEVLKQYGVTGALVARDYTADGIAEAIVRDTKGRNGDVCL